MGIFKQKAKTTGDFEVAPSGSHPAVLVAIIDLGTQTSEYQGKQTEARKVFFVWELVSEPSATGKCKNHVVGRDYTLSLNKKASLCSIVEKWTGKTLGPDEEFDIERLLGKHCLLSLVHKTSQNDKVYAKIDGVTGLPKDMKKDAKPATLKPFKWEIESGDPIPSEAWIPFVYGDSMESVIQKSPEWKNRGGDANEGVAAGVGTDAEFDTDNF